MPDMNGLGSQARCLPSPFVIPIDAVKLHASSPITERWDVLRVTAPNRIESNKSVFAVKCSL